MTTQLDGSIGFGLETTYGTKVVPTRWFEYTDAPFDWQPTFVQGQGQRVGTFVDRAQRRVLGKSMAGGDLGLEVVSKGIGFLFQAIMGASVSTQRATTGVFQHNMTPAATDVLNSYTMQAGVPLVGGGAAQALTFPGMVGSQFQLTAANNDILKMKTSWIGRDKPDTATAYTPPSYPANPMEAFSFAEGAITIGGTVTAPTTTALATGGTAVATIRDFNMTYDNGLDDAGYNLGSAGLRARKPMLGKRAITGSMSAEYSDNTLRDAYLAQADLALVLTFTGLGTIGTGSDKPGLSIYVPNIRLEKEVPHNNAGDPITVQSIDWTGLDNLTATSPIFVSYVSLDTLP